MSVPLRRIMLTRHARPRLASVAAKERRMSRRVMSFWLDGGRVSVRRRVIERIRASRESRAIRIWRR